MNSPFITNMDEDLTSPFLLDHRHKSTNYVLTKKINKRKSIEQDGIEEEEIKEEEESANFDGLSPRSNFRKDNEVSKS
jgi:hypothetical protein